MKTLLILGGGKTQLPYYETAHKMGLKVIGIDPYCSPIQGCHQFYQKDLKSYEELLNIAKKHQVNGIISNVELAVVNGAKIAKELNLPGMDPLCVQQVSEKNLLRDFLKKFNYAHPLFLFTDSLRDAKFFVEKYPNKKFVIKPVDSYGAKGVSLVNEKNPLNLAFEFAQQNSSQKKILVEEFIEGTEYSAEVFTDSSKVPKVLAIGKKTKGPFPYFVTQKITYSNFSHLKNLSPFLSELATKLRINFAHSHIEVIENDKDYFVVEMGARGAGSEISTQLIPQLTDQDLIKIHIEMALGEASYLSNSIPLKEGSIEFDTPENAKTTTDRKGYKFSFSEF